MSFWDIGIEILLKNLEEKKGSFSELKDLQYLEEYMKEINKNNKKQNGGE